MGKENASRTVPGLPPLSDVIHARNWLLPVLWPMGTWICFNAPLWTGEKLTATICVTVGAVAAHPTPFWPQIAFAFWFRQ